jgi:hypothetical protein
MPSREQHGLNTAEFILKRLIRILWRARFFLLIASADRENDGEGYGKAVH